MDYANIRQIHEFVTGIEDRANTEEAVNSCLAQGWVLLTVHQRSDSAGCIRTVYILGKQERNLEVEREGTRPAGAFLWG
jgi:hypothetical protein